MIEYLTVASIITIALALTLRGSHDADTQPRLCALSQSLDPAVPRDDRLGAGAVRVCVLAARDAERIEPMLRAVVPAARCEQGNVPRDQRPYVDVTIAGPSP